MKVKYTSLIRNIIIFAIGSMGSKFILFFLVPLYTNYLSNEEYGIAELITTISQLIMPIVTLNIFEAITRFGMMHGKKRENVLASGFIVIGFSILTTAFLILIIGMYGIIEQWKWDIYIITILYGINMLELSYLKVKDKNEVYTILSIVQTIMLAVLNIIFLMILNIGVKGYLLANVIAYCFADLAGFIFADIMRDLKKASIDLRLLKEMILFSIPLIFNNISWWLIHSTDKFMIQIMINTSSLGIYAVSAKIPSLLNVLTSVFSQAWGISAIKEVENNNDEIFYSKVFQIYSFVIFGTCIIVIPVIHSFMNIYVGKEFQIAWKYVPLLLVAAVFNSVSAYCGSLYIAVGKTLNSMMTTLCAAFVNIILNYVFISQLGLWGAVIGTIGCYFILSIIRLIDIKRYIKIQIKYKKYIFDIVLILLQAMFSLLYQNVYGYAIIIMLFCMNNIEEVKLLKNNLIKCSAN